jgi:hypothetical protein
MPLDFKTGLTVDNFAAQLHQHLVNGDPASFMAVCRAVKAKAHGLIESDRHTEAVFLISDYRKVFEKFHEMPPEFVLAIIDVFPKNHAETFKLLGLSDELDQAILTTKIDLPTLGMTMRDGYAQLLEWAVSQDQWPMLNSVVDHLVISSRHLDTDERTSLGKNIVTVLLSHRPNQRPFAPAVDDGISNLICVAGNSLNQSRYVPCLANLGMPKTLMKMLEHGMIAETPLQNYSPEQRAIIMAVIPKHPSPVQLRAIHFFLKPTGMTEQVLFDENVDLDGYIDALRNTQFKSWDGNDLNFEGIEVFFRCMTADNIAIPARRKRIAKLLNATFEAQHPDASQRHSRDAADDLLQMGVPPDALKLIDLLKGHQLEESLGL